MELNLKSGWSYCNKQILEISNSLPQSTTLSVLELGGGDSSIKLWDFLKTKYKQVTYRCYETDPTWAPQHDNIEVILYKTPSLVVFDDVVYDFILIDGPTGISRREWYSKLTNNVRPGTILHIDDYDHYKEFEEELAINFVYDELYRTSRTKRGEKSWLTVKIK